jgi:hypothetical protein
MAQAGIELKRQLMSVGHLVAGKHFTIRDKCSEHEKIIISIKKDDWLIMSLIFFSIIKGGTI